MSLAPVLLLLATAAPAPASAGSVTLESPVTARIALPEAEAAGPTVGLAGEDLFTLLDYFDAGQLRALRYVDRIGPGARTRFRLAELAAACVRVSCEREGGTSLAFSSGVLVAGGRRVVTAGHGIGAIGEPGMELAVVTADGRRFPARVLARSPSGAADQDWAVLELLDAPALGGAPVGLSAARPGGLAFILGYPERVGLGRDGHALASLASQPVPLEPLLFVARAPAAGTSGFEPLAGAVPLSGASGAPVFDESGALVGVLVAVGRVAWPDGVRHVYRVSPAADFAAALGS